MRRVLAILLLALSLGLGGCGIMPGAGPNLDRTEWKAVVVAGRKPIADREPLISFANGTLVGSDGCNAIEGQVLLDGARISVVELSGTDVACEAAVAEIARLFMLALTRAEVVRMDGDNLVIAGGGGEIVLVHSLGG